MLPLSAASYKIEVELHLIKTMLNKVLINQKNRNTTEEKIMNVNEAIEFIGMERYMLCAKCAKGEIPCFCMGKLYEFKRSELIQWMDKQRLQQIGMLMNM
jgi:predicted DNA-binding transcriptional regulator AlpA